MSPSQLLLAGAIFIISTAMVCGSSVCDHTDLHSAKTCQKIFKVLEQALIWDETNLYYLRKMFFYAPNANPVFFQVNYNISFGDNITEDLLPYCGGADNSTMIDIYNETEIIHGWTSSGVYLIINPWTLNKMQMSLPFMILRGIHKKYQESDIGSPEVDAFLWDGSYDLPTLYLNLHITAFPCIPSTDVFKSTLEDVTTYVSKMYCRCIIMEG